MLKFDEIHKDGYKVHLAYDSAKKSVDVIVTHNERMEWLKLPFGIFREMVVSVMAMAETK